MMVSLRSALRLVGIGAVAGAQVLGALLVAALRPRFEAIFRRN
ncbi:hypothetical protein [Kitasatospora sp. NPDC004289]